jgi:hypothetical protein
MYGLVKLAYSSREDDLLDQIDQRKRERQELENSIDPELGHEMNRTKLKHLGIGTGIGGIGLGGLAGLASRDWVLAAKAGLLGGLIGAGVGAGTGEIKAGSIFQEKDPELYHQINDASSRETEAIDSLYRHHAMKQAYAPAQRPVQVQVVQ